MKENRFILKFSAFVFLAAVLTAFSATAQWNRKSDALKSRSEVTSVVYDSKLYTFLGFGNSALQTEPTSEVYDPATNTWKLLAAIPAAEARTHQGVALIDNTVWHIGGRIGQNPGPLTSSIWIYNISQDAWYKGPQLKDPATGKPLQWAAGGAVLLGRTLHIVGGFVINACNNDQSAYHLTLDVDTWLADTSKPAQWVNNLAPLPVKRNHFGTVALGGKIYIIGGQLGHDCGGGLDKQYAHVYNPSTNTWTQLPLLPSPRSHVEGGTFAIDGKIFIVAGQGADGVSTNKVTIFDPAGNNGAGTWKDDATLTLPNSYEGVSAKVIKNTFIYSHGGQGSSSNVNKATYSRSIVRNPVHKLGFSSGCLSLTADSGKTVSGKTLLFTTDSSKSYITSSNVAWLTISKNASDTALQSAVDIEVTANTAGLAPGSYTATVTATGTGSAPDYAPADYCVNLTVKNINSAVDTLEAESAQLSGAKVQSTNTGFRGTGYADYINSSADYVQWSVNKTIPIKASLKFRYANGSTARPLKLEVNGVVISTALPFAATGSWTKWSATEVAVNLNAGTNTIKLTANGYSGPNIDYLVISNSTAVQTAQRTLSDETKKIYTANDVLKVYVSPNPATESARLNLTTFSALPVYLELSDMMGKTYYKTKLVNSGANSYNLPVSNLSNGTYIIRINQGNKTETTRFIINNKSSR